MGAKERTSLISAIVSVVRVDGVPPDVHRAALTLIGWLARRKREECPCQSGLVEARDQLVGLSGGRR